MQNVTPYLMFKNETEEAFTFYQSILGGELQMVRFGEMDGSEGTMSEEDSALVANALLAFGGPEQGIMASDVPSFMPPPTVGNNFYLTLEVDSAEEADRLFGALSDGDPQMPLQETEWAERYGMFHDRFGVNWMVNYTGGKG